MSRSSMASMVSPPGLQPSSPTLMGSTRQRRQDEWLIPDRLSASFARGSRHRPSTGRRVAGAPCPFTQLMRNLSHLNLKLANEAAWDENTGQAVVARDA